MKPTVEPFGVRRQRTNWWGLVLPLYYAIMIAGALYFFNACRIVVDAEIDRLARAVGL